jgi:hypothetical protein
MNHDHMKCILFPFLLIVVSCQTQSKYPEGGFDYPIKVSDSDTNFYYYPLKDIEPKKDAFEDRYAYLFYQPFDEPNLSIKPRSKETFRLSYANAFGQSVIITLLEDMIIVKKGNPSTIYTEDTSRLTEIENFHLLLLKNRYPIDTSGKLPFRKRYLDSLTKLYPQLLDPSYYHTLYEKIIVRKDKKFTYPVTKINLSKQEYKSLIQQINSSGFWTMPYKIECQYQPMDGDGFTLEANTRKRYKIVNVGGCPGDTTKFTKACQKLVEFAKMDKEIQLIWNWSGETISPDSADLPELKN